MFNSDAAMGTRSIASVVPTKTIHMPQKAGKALTQVNQLKTAGTNKGTAPHNPGVLGLPLAPVGMKVSQKHINATTKEVTVSWQRNSVDHNYQSANIHMRTGNGTPLLVNNAVDGPVKLIVPKHNLPITVFVQHVGKSGALPLEFSPVRTVKPI